MGLVDRILDGSLMPHGYCLVWRPDLLIMHVGGDIITAIAYFAIPFLVVRYVKQRPDLEFDATIIAFAAFIVCCGITHIINIVNIWHGYYFIEGLAKATTAAISMYTVFLLWRMGPTLLRIPTIGELQQKTRSLEQVREHLEDAKATLEARVAERTSELQTLARTDDLTGLANRRHFEEIAGDLLRECVQDDSRHALCFIDLDQFKVINDSSGHVAGDHVLRECAAILLSSVRSADFVARMGGDEFAVILKACPLERAEAIMLEALKRIRAYRLDWEGRYYSIAASIGIVECTRHVPDLVTLMSEADTACYVAKDRGRNQIFVHREDSEELHHARKEMNWVSCIERAIDEDLFELYAQPIFRTADSSVAGMEILLRLRDGEDPQNILNPGAFLSAAERFGLAPRIDRCVIRKTIEFIERQAAWPAGLVPVSINVSGASIGDAEFRRDVLAMLSAQKLPRGMLSFELTETAAVSHMSVARDFILACREYNVSFSIDDFGVGASSLTYLKELPAATLKIDGGFIAQIDQDPADKALVISFITLGKSLGLATVAERVDSQRKLEILRELGIDYVQGFLLARPAPVAHVLETYCGHDCQLTAQRRCVAIPTPVATATTLI